MSGLHILVQIRFNVCGGGLIGPFYVGIGPVRLDSRVLSRIPVIVTLFLSAS